MKDSSDREDTAPEHRVRALFISDVHLGTRTAQAERLLDLLRSFEAESVYLVGDIIDLWKVRRGPHWPQSHNDVLQKLMRKVRKGTRLVLIPRLDRGLEQDVVDVRSGPDCEALIARVLTEDRMARARGEPAGVAQPHAFGTGCIKRRVQPLRFGAVAMSILGLAMFFVFEAEELQL